MNPNFITTLAWIFGTLSTMLICLRLYTKSTYNERDAYFDAIKGVRREFPIMVPLIVAIVCWTWVLTT